MINIISLEIRCDLPTTPANCVVEGNAVNYRSTVVYKCHKGFAMVSGDKYRTCQSNGSWNGTEPSCAGSVELYASVNAIFVCKQQRNFLEGNIYCCLAVNRYSDLTKLLICFTERLFCTLNKTITTSLAVKRCSGPPAVANTTWSVDKKSFEQRVIYKCLPRFHLVSGELAKVCSSELKWTGDDPVCVGEYKSVVYTTMIYMTYLSRKLLVRLRIIYMIKSFSVGKIPTIMFV